MHLPPEDQPSGHGLVDSNDGAAFVAALGDLNDPLNPMRTAAVAKVPRAALDALNDGNPTLARSLLGAEFAGSGGTAGSAGGGGVVNHYYQQTVVVQGSVLSERDLRDATQRQFLQLGGRNSSSYTPYVR